jgi:hypothetical protein
MFSGTVFYADTKGALKVVPISWEQETRFKLPVKVRREMMDSYYPNSVWLSLRRDVFERLSPIQDAPRHSYLGAGPGESIAR